MPGRAPRVDLGGLIVSCQAYPGEPLNDAGVLGRIASAVVEGGASAVRLQGLDTIRRVVGNDIAVPVIGLWKDGHEGVYVTPTLDHAIAVADAGAAVVALDGTRRPRPDGRTLAETVAALRRERPAVSIMADCGSMADAAAAEAAGVDVIGTTLAGYTGERANDGGPDLTLVEEIVSACRTPVIAEGRYADPADVARAFRAGALAVCVGGAITHPTSITRRFIRESGLSAPPST